MWGNGIQFHQLSNHDTSNGQRWLVDALCTWHQPPCSRNHSWMNLSNVFKTTSLLKCYLSRSDVIKKTHTGSIYWGSSYGGRGWVMGGYGEGRNSNRLYESDRRRYSPCERFAPILQDIYHHPVGRSSVSTWCYSANVGYRGLVVPNQARFSRAVWIWVFSM